MKDVKGSKVLWPRKLGHLKRECHRLMQEIWGNPTAKEGYQWLGERFGRTINFSTINDVLFLQEIYRALWFHQAKIDAESLDHAET